MMRLILQVASLIFNTFSGKHLRLSVISIIMEKEQVLNCKIYIDKKLQYPCYFTTELSSAKSCLHLIFL